MNKQTWTGERLTTKGIDDFPWLCAYGLITYGFTAQYCYNKNVLDTFCGLGFGMNAIGPFCRSISGGDICSKTLDEARELNIKNLYKFRQIDFETESIVESFGQQFDTIICLNSIEHIVNPMQFLRNVNEALTPDGVFILNIPVYCLTDYHKLIFTFDQALLVGNDVLDEKEVWLQVGVSIVEYDLTKHNLVDLPGLNSNGTFVLKKMGKRE